jgi:hypothetical protein
VVEGAEEGGGEGKLVEEVVECEEREVEAGE